MTMLEGRPPAGIPGQQSGGQPAEVTSILATKCAVMLLATEYRVSDKAGIVFVVDFEHTHDESRKRSKSRAFPGVAKLDGPCKGIREGEVVSTEITLNENGLQMGLVVMKPAI